jgi:hypothetical protein
LPQTGPKAEEHRACSNQGSDWLDHHGPRSQSKPGARVKFADKNETERGQAVTGG